MSQGSFSPKIRFLGQMVCSVARSQTDRQTDMKVKTGTPFQDFVFFKFPFNLSSRSGTKWGGPRPPYGPVLNIIPLLVVHAKFSQAI